MQAKFSALCFDIVLFRQRKEGDSDPRFNLSNQGLMPVSEVNSNLVWKQVMLKAFY
jgi:hypothetical protein